MIDISKMTKQKSSQPSTTPPSRRGVDRMIDERVLAVEARAKAVPGTTFSRCLLDASICKDHDIELTDTEKNKGCALVWCLAVGPMQMPKFMIYARRIDECVSKVERIDECVVTPKRKVK